MKKNDVLTGILLRGGYLKTEKGEILLTGIEMQMSVAPESGALDIPPGDIGKVSLVRGQLSDGVLYSAEIEETLSPLTSGLITTLTKTGVVRLDEIQSQVQKIIAPPGEAATHKKLCALVVGHKASAQGAVNEVAHLSEFEFNDDLAARVESKVQNTDVQIVYRETTYSDLPDEINAFDPDFVISLHCNAYDKSVSGTEVLYYHTSAKGEAMARVVLRRLVACLGLRDRGAKPKTVEDDGGPLLRYTNAPCVIAEPFFIDNDGDLATARENIEGLADAYAEAIDEIAAEVV